mgnify:CR=1 FL=1|jgi:endoglucanase
MNKDAFLELARQIMPLPTAPYHEQFVGEAIAAFAASRPRLVMSADDFGNLHLLYDPDREEIAPGRRRPRRLPRLVVTAHMDHPGMGFDKRISRRDFLFERLGGVPEDLTRNGEVDIYRLDRPADQKPIRGNISACVETAAGGSAFFKVRVARGDADEVGPGSFAMLALQPLAVGRRRLRARACDDLAGVTAGLCFLDELLARRSPIRAGLLLTRAEETGLGGMLAAARSGSLDRRALYVNIECSSCRAGAQLGAGPVVRVGDRVSLFDPNITGGLVAVAQELARAAADGDHPFRYQRKLMDGGTCEATALIRAGYLVGAVALPLKNYHNAGRNGLRPEMVDIDDAVWLVELLVELALHPAGVAGTSKVAIKKTERAMDARYREQARRLRRQPLQLSPSLEIADGDSGSE